MIIETVVCPQINGVNVYAFSTLGYLCYTLGQVFHFCLFGNTLIEEVRRGETVKVKSSKNYHRSVLGETCPRIVSRNRFARFAISVNCAIRAVQR